MIKFLLILLIPVFIIAGFGYWRYSASKDLKTPEAGEISNGPVEVPKSLPEATLDEKVDELTEVVTEIVKKINNPTPTPSSDVETRMNSAETTITELKARVSALESASPAPAAAAQSATKSPTMFIPLGAGGNWNNQDWVTVAQYEISLDSANYPGYTGMVLEANIRIVEPGGTGYVRLYNTSDNTVTSSEISTTATTYSVHSSSSFKLASGSKTYKLQTKVTPGMTLYVDFARIRVNF